MSGKPILASDPHLGAQLPSTWYLMGLHDSEGDYIIGASMPGVPSIPIGKTKYMSIGITAHLSDVTDLFKEKVDMEKE